LQTVGNVLRKRRTRENCFKKRQDTFARLYPKQILFGRILSERLTATNIALQRPPLMAVFVLRCVFIHTKVYVCEASGSVKTHKKKGVHMSTNREDYTRRIIALLEERYLTSEEAVSCILNKKNSNMSQADYEKLAKEATWGVTVYSDFGIPIKKENGFLTDDEARVLVNKKFGFEASRVKILQVAEVGASYSYKSGCFEQNTAPRRPINISAMQNYIRFYVESYLENRQYEMNNGELHKVNLFDFDPDSFRENER
jgi:hypothetical protein